MNPDELVRRFMALQLPKEEWTHEAHLTVGMWHVHRFGRDEALKRLRDGIRRLNDDHGTPNSETRGYHETITRAYVTVLARYLAECEGQPLEGSVASLLASPVAAKDYLLRFYSRDLLMSREARATWIEPDLRDL